MAAPKSEPGAKTKRPSKEEMDERLIVPLTPDELVEGILRVKPEDEDEKSDED
ncbi:MAG: hypothetical protein ABWY77_02305 [Acidimicrobiia bacterium]